MAAGNKIHTKAYRDKMHGVAEEIRRLAACVNLDARQRRFLYQRMNEYKLMCESGAGAGFQNENTTNSIENSWCPKNTSSALREKTEELSAMQKTVDKMSSEIQVLRAKCKRMHVLEQQMADRLAVEGLENENRDLKSQLAELQRKAIESKLSFQNSIDRYREKADALQKALAEAKNRASEQPPSLDMANALCTISDLHAEIARYRERVLGLTADLATSEKVVRNTQEVVSVLERAIKDLEGNPRVKIITGEERSPEEVEHILGEELSNASAAFERVSRTNRDLEQQVAQLHKKTQLLFSENAHLKNKEKLYEEAKIAIEKERRRFESCRAEVQEIRGRLERQQQAVNESGQSAKLEHYKTVAKSHEQNWIAVIHELKNTKEAYQNALFTLEKLQASYQQLEHEHKRQERWIATYKALSGEDGQPEAVDDIETYRKILRCTLCDANLKNCTIVKCMHCFCMGCLQSRIKSRLRTCPACDCDFTMNDVKKIYL